MAAKKKASKKVATKAGTKKRRGVKLTPTELEAPELAVSDVPAELSPVL